MSGPKTPKKRTLHLRLYVAGDAPNSVAAVRHLRTLLASYPSHVTLEIIDVLQNPEPGSREGVLVTPTMIKLAPSPVRRIIGNLKDTEALISVLGLMSVEHE